MQERHNVKCFGCGRNTYHETLMREWCSSCGIDCNYATGISNDAMNKAIDVKHAIEEEARKKRWEDEFGEKWQ